MLNALPEATADHDGAPNYPRLNLRKPKGCDKSIVQLPRGFAQTTLFLVHAYNRWLSFSCGGIGNQSGCRHLCTTHYAARPLT